MELKSLEMKIDAKSFQTRIGFEKIIFKSLRELKIIINENNGKIVLVRSKGKTYHCEKNKLYIGTINPANEKHFYFTEGLSQFNPKHIIPYSDIEKMYLLDRKKDN